MEKIHSTLAFSLFNVLPKIHSKQLEKIGIDPSLLVKLTEFSLSDLMAVAEQAESFLSIQIDASVMAACLKDELLHRADSKIQDEMIVRHATYKMMKELFGMHTTEFSARRKILGLAGDGQHRPQFCDIETSMTIYDIWLKYSELEAPQRYLRVAADTGMPLNIIQQAIRKNEGTNNV